MLVYHGSNSNFKQLRISKSLVNRENTLTNEGLGIYFSTNKEIASSYGKYLYTIDINDRILLDFTKRQICERFINSITNEVYKKHGFNLRQFMGNDTINMLIINIYCGGVGIAFLGREYSLLLDSNEYWHTNVSSTMRSKVIVSINQFIKNHLIAYRFRYSIDDVGVIKNLDNRYIKLVSQYNLYSDKEKRLG